MAIAFSIAVYVLAGIVSVAWLRALGRLPRGLVSLGMAALFWPAFLPVCMSSPRAAEGPASLALADPKLVLLARRLEHLPIDAARRAAHHRALVRLEAALAHKRGELHRLEVGDARLAELAGALAGEERRFVAEERGRLAEQAARARDELARAEASVANLAVRLEVLVIRASRSPADLEEPFTLGAELERLIEAQDEVERLAPSAGLA